MKNKKIVVTYSSINGNGWGGYGEVVMGTKGTIVLENEADYQLYSTGGPSTFVDVVKKDSGITLQVAPDQTVLDALRAANIDIQSDCEEGLCGSCEVRVLDGQIDHRDVVLTRAEREANTKMMTCCSRACGKKLVLEL